MLWQGIGVPLGTEEVWGPCPLWDWGVAPRSRGSRDPGILPCPIRELGSPSTKGMWNHRPLRDWGVNPLYRGHAGSLAPCPSP